MELSQAAYDMICCSSCKEINFPMYACKNSKRSVCNNCYDVGEEEEMFPQILIEEMVKDCCIIKCHYGKCGYMSSWENLKKHKELCDYRPVECPIVACKESNFDTFSIVDHFKDKHDVLDGDTFELKR